MFLRHHDMILWGQFISTCTYEYLNIKMISHTVFCQRNMLGAEAGNGPLSLSDFEEPHCGDS